MDIVKQLKEDLNQKANSEKAKACYKFFQVFPGGYGEGDVFIGVNVPDQRAVALKYYKETSLELAGKLLSDKVHEHRLTAVFILVLKYEKSKTEEEKKSVVDEYLKNISGVNNWDIVDSSAHKILGPYLFDKDKSLLYNLISTGELWKQRIAIISTFHYIGKKQYAETLKMAELLLNHKHDLIHKAVGWALREIGKRDFQVEYNFLQKHYKQMPRTMLRYAIEKFDEELRQRFLKR
jgi:3-methyladenine DNA glycosylase AlkD